MTKVNRQYLLDLAASGLRMPIGADLVLHEKPDPQDIIKDGARLGQVVVEAAKRYNTPLSVPLMDLMLEKTVMLELLGISEADIPTYHFSGCPTDEQLTQLEEGLKKDFSQRMQAHVDAVSFVASNSDLVPVGMVIGPFSLMTKLIAEPITPVYLLAQGETPEDDEDVRTLLRVLEMSISVILRSVKAQIQAGAQLVVVAEPAANKVYISPNQLDEGSDIFDRLVIAYNQRIKDLLKEHDIELFFHCCGELTEDMLSKFTQLDPGVLSLGSSRILWEDAEIVPRSTVLFGNLPSKRFYSDDTITEADVELLSKELLRNMKRVGHPFILGSECDVLSVQGCESIIKAKVDRFVSCSCD